MKPQKPAGATRRTAPEYAQELAIGCTPERLFDAIATLDGLRGWWSTDVIGSPAVGDILRFGFALPSHNEWIVMRVEAARMPAFVEWKCVAQYVAPGALSEHDEWIGTRVTFDVGQSTPGACQLRFRHHGLTPRLECYDICERGWDYFLASLVALVERGAGTPFGA